MIRFERTRDYELVRSILTHPKVYRHMVSDGAVPADEYRAVEDEKLWYMLAFDDDELLGMFLLVPRTNVCFEVHVSFLPNGWGRALAAYRAGIEWVWANTPCRKLIGNTPADNRLALRIAKRAGMQVIGVNEKSIRKYGVLLDQVIFGIGAQNG